MPKTTVPREQRVHLVRLSVLVHMEIIQRLKVAAAIDRKTMSQVVEDLVRAHLPELHHLRQSQEEQLWNRTSDPAPALPCATIDTERER